MDDENKVEQNVKQKSNNIKKSQDSKMNKIFKEIGEWIFCFIIAYVLYLNINYFFGTMSGVKQVSMKPTALEGERLIVQRPKIFKRQIQHDDIITFEAPSESTKYLNEEVIDDNIAKYIEYTGLNKFLYNFIGIGKISYIKRVIGIEGDHIQIKEDGQVYRNEGKLIESYTKDKTTNINGKYVDVIVPKGCVFVMGDNRLESKDSRFFGCIPINKVNGYVICRVWPFNRLGKV
ncbi:MAG: signal peptidase I [Clostridia bacterium]